MARYQQIHYGRHTWRLVHPKVIVEHYTAGTSATSAWYTFASNSRFLGELPGTRAQVLRSREPPAGPHAAEPAHRLQRADEDGSTHPLGLTYRVQQRVDAIGAVDVGLPRRPKQGRRPGGESDKRVAGRL